MRLVEELNKPKGPTALESWEKFAKNPKDGMTFEEFTAGYQSFDPEATEKEIREAFYYGDSDGQDGLSWDEFKRLYAHGEGAPGGLKDKLKWYYENFVEDKKKGMTL